MKKTVEAGEDHKRKKHSPKTNRLVDDVFLDVLVAEISNDPGKSMREIARSVGVSHTTIMTAIAIASLGIKSNVQHVRHILTLTTMANHVLQMKKLLSCLHKVPPSTVRIFSDKILQTVDQVHNSRFDWVLAFSPEDVPAVLQSKHPVSRMQFGMVTSNGCFNGVFSLASLQPQDWHQGVYKAAENPCEAMA